MEPKNKVDIKDWYYQKFKTFESSLNGQSKTYLHNLRKQAIEKFVELGFPTSGNEEWKYTNVSPLLTYNFSPAVLDKESIVSDNEVEKYLVKDLQINLIVFVNGAYVKNLSAILPQADRIEIINFFSKSQSDVNYIEQHFAKYALSDNGFVALNTAFSNDGIIIKIPDNLVLENPIHFFPEMIKIIC
jgi:Fe-S cluster assembly protein SufD